MLGHVQHIQHIFWYLVASVGFFEFMTLKTVFLVGFVTISTFHFITAPYFFALMTSHIVSFWIKIVVQIVEHF